MRRYSSLRGRRYSEVLGEALQGARSYDRIAGYFSSSVLALAAEAIESMEGCVRLVCNSDLSKEDVRTAQLAMDGLRQQWCALSPEALPLEGERFGKLYDLLVSRKLQVKVLPREEFGLVHGKAGVITCADGSQLSFLGSANATFSAWQQNYELVWEDTAAETVAWVQEEFDLLWHNPAAIDLSRCQYILTDLKRLAKRSVIPTVNAWQQSGGAPAAVVVESPVNRKNFGLWEHQKYFVEQAFRDHKTPCGARYVLADEVGLGKTLQLAVAAELMALYGTRPVLIIVPKTLLNQWQTELLDLLELPTAIWTGRGWQDENACFYPLPIAKCPRKIGMISQGIINNGSDSCLALREQLLAQNYECVIVDESHRARRRDLSEKAMDKAPVMNNLYKFLMALSKRTHSMLLATATPVQLNKIEAFDLLNILSQANASVLGDNISPWRHPYSSVIEGLELITGDASIEDIGAAWRWMRNPLPPEREHPSIRTIRRQTQMKEDNFHCRQLFSEFSPQLQRRIVQLKENAYFLNYNPYIRHIVRRQRSYLEDNINPETNLPYLPKITVVLLGDRPQDSLLLTGYMRDAYKEAENFCQMLQKRCNAAGLFKTLLLRRIGSSMLAGYNTGSKMLQEWNVALSQSEEDDEAGEGLLVSEALKDLTGQETASLQRFVNLLGQVITSKNLDPKYNRTLELLTSGAVLTSGQRTKPWQQIGCIIFSQYFATVEWIARNVSEELHTVIGVYAGGDKSGIYDSGVWHNETREQIKAMVKARQLKIIVGTDAASEGLNLQTLGALINLDLPWNPTRLEQRKGRIQRIGQVNDVVYVYNMRYKDSVEDRVHSLLSARMESIYKLFGQLPDVLEDVWVDVAVGRLEEAQKRLAAIPEKHPFEVKYNEKVEPIDWESCATVLEQTQIRKKMLEMW